MKQMRRSDCLKNSEWALSVFDKAPYVTLSMMRADGTPYGLPLNIVRKNATVFYFHCASRGEKIECLRHNPIVSISAVSKCCPRFEEVKNNFTEHYHSAIALAEAEIVTDGNEKIDALRLICERFLPRFMEHFDAAVARSLDITTVVRLTLVEPPVGKCKPNQKID